MKNLLAIAVTMLCSCDPPDTLDTPKQYGHTRDTGPKPTDVVYWCRFDAGDIVPVQVTRLRSGATFIVIGTDTHGTPIVYTHNAEGWKRDE